MARLEHQAYWAERMQIDFESWSRRPAFRAAFRIFTALRRLKRRLL
jgi:hypothetical protein